MCENRKKENDEIGSSNEKLEEVKELGSEATNHERKDCLDEHRKGNDKRKLIEEEGYFLKRKKPKLKQRGMNKNRPTFKVNREDQLCPRLVDRQADSDPGCAVEGCVFTHDMKQYLDRQPPKLGDECYVFNTKGYCPRGLTCRFGTKHVTKEGLNIVNENVYEEWKSNYQLHTSNSLKHEVQTQLWKKTYNFEKSEKILSQWSQEHGRKKAVELQNDNPQESKIAVDENSEPKESKTEVLSNKMEESEIAAVESSDIKPSGTALSEGGCDNIGSVPDNKSKMITNQNDKVCTRMGPVTDTDIIKLRSEEKKKINWREKLFLSPLTTVGNLPFRRICKEFGADVTCGEMATAVNLLQGKTQEWALTKRHGSEDLFGVQICGSNANVMTRCAQLVQEQANIDFVDINVGCPIDLIYQQGAGSGLLNKKKVLFSIVKCMKSVLDIPLTVKTRTGVYSGKNVAHTFMEQLGDAGVDLITVHGRSKEQRYTKMADWRYIELCAKLAAPTPVIGNGDILSYTDYDLARDTSPSAGSIMIGRGALIKPWIFTELKERRHWDISSHERFEILQKYTNYGLEHWGSDTRGVESTRRFLLEWLSFLYRYVPVGILENPPQKMNERPPKFKGRDDLETLMASPNCSDWIEITEMLLGPVPVGFQFLPKHKANSWM